MDYGILNPVSIYQVENSLESAPSAEEVKEAIRDLKRSKATGEDGLSAELLNLFQVNEDSEVIFNNLFDIIKDVWATEEVPRSGEMLQSLSFIRKRTKLSAETTVGYP